MLIGPGSHVLRAGAFFYPADTCSLKLLAALSRNPGVYRFQFMRKTSADPPYLPRSYRRESWGIRQFTRLARFPESAESSTRNFFAVSKFDPVN
jgi:hypothetical protein